MLSFLSHITSHDSLAPNIPCKNYFYCARHLFTFPGCFPKTQPINGPSFPLPKTFINLVSSCKLKTPEGEISCRGLHMSFLILPALALTAGGGCCCQVYQHRHNSVPSFPTNSGHSLKLRVSATPCSCNFEKQKHLKLSQLWKTKQEQARYHQLKPPVFWTKGFYMLIAREIIFHVFLSLFLQLIHFHGGQDLLLRDSVHSRV